MKRILPIVGLLAASTTAFGQLPVSQTGENKNVVLEEFTGIHCTFCPDGHKRAQQLADANPGDVVLINVHAGSYATPSAGELDFRTSFGTAIANQSGLQGYPAGQINRRNFAGYEQTDANGNPVSGILAQGRGTWATTAPTVLGESSYINVALEADVDAATREMTIDVEMFETGTAPASYNLNIALLQSNIEGTQTGSSANPAQVLPNGNYLHSHALRHLITGQWGEVINSASGVITRSYTYTLPADIAGIPVVMGDISIVAFIAEGQTNIITGEEGEINYTNLATNDGAVANVVAPEVICGSTVDADFTLTNNGGNAMTAATIEYGIAGQPTQTYNWTGNLGTFASEDITLTGVTVPSGGGVLDVTITAVNGGADSNAGNNNTSSSSISITTDNGQGVDYDITVVQDRYGDEITLTLKDANGSTVASGGPYSQLSANGTQTHTSSVTLSSTGCYEFEILDSYGDGINSGYGVGSYNLKTSTGAIVFSSNGQYGGSENKPFEITSLSVGVEEIAINNLNIYPNPVADNTTIEFDAESSEVSMTVTNSLGAVIANNFTVANGFNRISIDCTDYANGLYFVTLSSNGQTIMKKFNVIK